MIDDNESKPGSIAYARETAAHCEHRAACRSEITFSKTDLQLVATWARYHASRWHRRAAIAAAFVIVAALGVGLPDMNGDGRVSLADIGFAAKAIVGWVESSGTATAMEQKS